MHFSIKILFVLFFLFLNCNTPDFDYNFTEKGKASYYANLFIGRETANGDIFSQDSLTAAHRTLPFGTKVLVTNVKNRKSIIVYINDRGPFVRNRVIDLTRRAADTLGMLHHGIAKVDIRAFIEDPEIAEEFSQEVNK